MKTKNGEYDKRCKYDWHSVDWNQPTCIIACQMSTSENIVSRARMKYSPTSKRSIHFKTEAAKDRLMEIDWSQRTVDIANKMGLSPSRVSHMRTKAKK